MRSQAEIRRAYRANYDRIAHDHVTHWREHGVNPFQPEHERRSHEDMTIALIEKHTQPCEWLDVGCGMGDLLMRLPSYQRYGIDLSDDYLDVAVYERKLYASKADAEKIPYPANRFGLVTATDLLEHVLDVNRVVKELLRVTKPGGIVIVRTPNQDNLSGYVEYDTYEFVHLRAFDAPSLHLLFGKVFGCEVLETPVIDGEVHAVVRK